MGPEYENVRACAQNIEGHREAISKTTNQLCDYIAAATGSSMTKASSEEIKTIVSTLLTQLDAKKEPQTTLETTLELLGTPSQLPKAQFRLPDETVIQCI